MTALTQAVQVTLGCQGLRASLGREASRWVPSLPLLLLPPCQPFLGAVPGPLVPLRAAVVPAPCPPPWWHQTPLLSPGLTRTERTPRATRAHRKYPCPGWRDAQAAWASCYGPAGVGAWLPPAVSCQGANWRRHFVSCIEEEVQGGRAVPRQDWRWRQRREPGTAGAQSQAEPCQAAEWHSQGSAQAPGCQLQDVTSLFLPPRALQASLGRQAHPACP